MGGEIDHALRGADIAGARGGALDLQAGHHHVPALVLAADEPVGRHAHMVEGQFVGAGGAAAEHVELAQRQPRRVVVDQEQRQALAVMRLGIGLDVED